MVNPRGWNSLVNFSWLLKSNEIYEVTERCFGNLTFLKFCPEQWKMQQPMLPLPIHMSFLCWFVLFLVCKITGGGWGLMNCVWYAQTFGSWEHASEAESCLCLLPPLLPSGLNSVLPYLFFSSVARSVILGPPKCLWPWTHLFRVGGSAVVWDREH